jgi:hypothetical protein
MRDRDAALTQREDAMRERDSTSLAYANAIRDSARNERDKAQLDLDKALRDHKIAVHEQAIAVARRESAALEKRVCFKTTTAYNEAAFSSRWNVRTGIQCEFLDLAKNVVILSNKFLLQ